MNSDSWASYRAAMPPECFGEPDDEPRRRSPPHCSRCGRFFNPKAEGARTDYIPATLISEEEVNELCPKCAEVTPLPPSDEELKEWARREIEAYNNAMAAAWEAEMAANRGPCERCGRELPGGHATNICEECVTSDESPYTGEEIPY